MTFMKNFAKFLVKMSLNGIKFDLESKILFVSLPKLGILDVFHRNIKFVDFFEILSAGLILEWV